MIEAIKQRLTYANVMATIAVFIALGGSSYAALSITGRDVRNSSLTYRDLKKNTLGGSRIKEQRLGLVPRARNAARLNGVTAERIAGPLSQWHLSGVRRLCRTKLPSGSPVYRRCHRVRGGGAPRYAWSPAPESR